MRNMTISLKLVVPGIVLQSSHGVIPTLADEGLAGISLLM
jgi:hypothetical protein